MSFVQNIKLSWEAGGVMNTLYVISAITTLFVFACIIGVVLYFIPQMIFAALFLWVFLKGLGILLTPSHKEWK